MTRNRGSKGFTLVEIMIVVLIIGILMAIAVPNFVQARSTSRRNACVSSLKHLDSRKEEFAMDNNLDNGAAIAWANIVPQYLKSQPTCPSNGTYALGVIGTNPTCTVATHTIP